MSLDHQAIAQLEASELDALIASAGAEVVSAVRRAGTAMWVVTVHHARGGSVGYGATLLVAVVDAVWATEQAGGLELSERGAA